MSTDIHPVWFVRPPRRPKSTLGADFYRLQVPSVEFSCSHDLYQYLDTDDDSYQKPGSSSSQARARIYESRKPVRHNVWRATFHTAIQLINVWSHWARSQCYLYGLNALPCILENGIQSCREMEACTCGYERDDHVAQNVPSLPKQSTYLTDAYLPHCNEDTPVQ